MRTSVLEYHPPCRWVHGFPSLQPPSKDQGEHQMNASLTESFLKARRISVPEQKPRDIAEVGVRETLLEDIALKTLYLYGPFSVLDLAEQMRLGFEVAEQLFNRLRAKLFCEVSGMLGHVPEITISSHGRTRALELLSQ